MIILQIKQLSRLGPSLNIRSKIERFGIKLNFLKLIVGNTIQMIIKGTLDELNILIHNIIDFEI